MTWYPCHFSLVDWFTTELYWRQPRHSCDVVRMSQPLVPNDREFVANFVQIVFIILIIDSLLWIDARSSAIPGIPLHVLGPEVRLSLNSQLNFLVEVVV